MDAFSAAMEMLRSIQESDERRSKRPLVPQREIETFMRNEMRNPFLRQIPNEVRENLREEFIDVKRLEGIPDTQSLSDYLWLEEIKKACDDVIRTSFLRDECCPCPSIYFGTSETLHLNAIIDMVPETDAFLVVINRGAWLALRNITHIVATTLHYEHDFRPSGSQLDVLGYSASPEGAVFTKNVARVIEFLRGNIHGIGVDHLAFDSAEESYWGRSHHSALMFLFGHEYSHFLRGHIRADKPLHYATVTNPNSREDFQITAKMRWQEEYEADRTALDMAVMNPRTRYLSKATSAEERQIDSDILFELMITGVEGALFTLQCFNIMERLSGVLSSASSTHPPPMLRMNRIFDAVSKQCKDYNHYTEVMRRLGHSLKVFDIVDQFVPPSFERAAEEFIYKLLRFERQERVLNVLAKIESWLRAGEWPNDRSIDDLGLTNYERMLIHNLRVGLQNDVGGQKACVDLLQKCASIIGTE